MNKNDNDEKQEQTFNVASGLTGYLIAAIVGLAITVYCIATHQTLVSVLVFAAATILFFGYCFYELYRFNKNGVDEVTAVCTDVKKTSLGFGATNSKTYCFQVINKPDDLNIPDETFELQFQVNTSDAIVYSLFKKNLRKSKKNEKKEINTGSVCKLYFSYQKHRDKFIPTNTALLGYEVVPDEIKETEEEQDKKAA